ncbi:MAG: M14 family metallopeptidase, partial [Candidatus Promineifilaceae bacterium]|nr:M14 family metallopeptidase [Candidatus Promineifilaceae bacterium]
NAPSSVELAQTAVEWLSGFPEEIPAELTVFVVPNMNPDGNSELGGLAARYNVNRVDLNRNWDCNWHPDPLIFDERRPGAGGKKPFSEPENVALATLIRRAQPEAVVFWDAAAPRGLTTAGGCPTVGDEAQALSEVYSRAAGYRLATARSSDLEGDVSDWLVGQDIPAIFVLLPERDQLDWEPNLKAMQAVLDHLAG